MTERRVPVLRSAEELAGWLAEQPQHRYQLLVDSAVVGSRIHGAVHQAFAGQGIDLPETRVTPDQVEQILLEGLPGHEVGDRVVALGGGMVMDLAKLLAVITASEDAALRLWSAQRSSLVALPEVLGTTSDVVAVPTTIGTGSEIAPVACYPGPHGKRIVCAPCLRPLVAVRDARATEDLPVHLLVEGVLESLFRAVSPYLGDAEDHPEADQRVHRLAEAVVIAGEELHRQILGGEQADASLRGRLGDLSAASQVGDTNAGREPCTVRAWALGTELSEMLGIRKMQAICAIWPSTWRQILAGDERWGQAAKLRLLWARVHRGCPGLPEDPASGIETLISRWLGGDRVELSPGQVDELTRRAMRSWGAGLPVLGLLRAEDVRNTYHGLCPADPAHPLHEPALRRAS